MIIDDIWPFIIITGLIDYDELKIPIIRFLEQYSYFSLSTDLKETPLRFAPPTVCILSNVY